IETIENVTGWTNEAQKQQLMGEVYFLRALYYFELSQLFGEVPLLTTSLVTNVPKASAEETYGVITEDLKTAIEIMPSSPYSSIASGHATKWAAQALLARVFLFYTGYYNQTELPLASGGAVTKTEVVRWLEECISDSGH